MINIKFEDKDNTYSLSITGHAEFDEKGKDIVCAAVSILFYTLCESLSNMTEALKEDPKISFEDGDGSISVAPKDKYFGNISLMFFTILNGFSLLASEYPDYIKII